jgi:hypothetical protein
MIDLNSLRAACAATLGVGLALAIAGSASAQNVINSNTTIRSSLCVGSDCLDTETYGFDTIRLKENNTRLNFVDTSVGAFPTRDWAIRANDSASGGANYLGIVDRGNDNSGSTVVARFEASAPANSLVVEGDGDVGIGTLNPVVKLHAVKGNSPALRLEQDGSSGFAPQTWDIAGNETNFFVRDATNGSQLPFRIFPNSGGDTLVTRNGNVGIGTSNPTLSVGGAGLNIVSATNPEVHLHHTASGIGPNDGANIALTGTDLILTNREAGDTLFFVNGAVRMRIASSGFIGIGTPTPTAQLHTTGGVRLAGITNCANGLITDPLGDVLCSPSTRRVKNIAGVLDPHVALANVMALRPQIGAYKFSPDVPEHWLIAEDVAEVEPALVGLKDGEPFTVKTYGVVADLVAVIQLQQRELEAQHNRIEALESALTAQ